MKLILVLFAPLAYLCYQCTRMMYMLSNRCTHSNCPPATHLGGNRIDGWIVHTLASTLGSLEENFLDSAQSTAEAAKPESWTLKPEWFTTACSWSPKPGPSCELAW